MLVSTVVVRAGQLALRVGQASYRGSRPRGFPCWRRARPALTCVCCGVHRFCLHALSQRRSGEKPPLPATTITGPTTMRSVVLALAFSAASASVDLGLPCSNAVVTNPTDENGGANYGTRTRVQGPPSFSSARHRADAGPNFRPPTPRPRPRRPPVIFCPQAGARRQTARSAALTTTPSARRGQLTTPTPSSTKATICVETNFRRPTRRCPRNGVRLKASSHECLSQATG